MLYCSRLAQLPAGRCGDPHRVGILSQNLSPPFPRPPPFSKALCPVWQHGRTSNRFFSVAHRWKGTLPPAAPCSGLLLHAGAVGCSGLPCCALLGCHALMRAASSFWRAERLNPQQPHVGWERSSLVQSTELIPPTAMCFPARSQQPFSSCSASLSSQPGPQQLLSVSPSPVILLILQLILRACEW